MQCPICNFECNETHDTYCPSCGFPLKYADTQDQDIIEWLNKRLGDNSKHSQTFDAQNYASFSDSDSKELQESQTENAETPYVLEKIIKNNQEIIQNINNLGHNQDIIIDEVKKLDKKIEEQEQEQLNIKSQLSELEGKFVTVEKQEAQLSELEEKFVTVEKQESQLSELKGKFVTVEKQESQLSELEETVVTAEEKQNSQISNLEQKLTTFEEERYLILSHLSTLEQRLLAFEEKVSQLSTLEEKLATFEEERSQHKKRLNQLDNLSTKFAEIEEYIQAKKEVISASNTTQYSSVNPEEEQVINTKTATFSERELSLEEYELVEKYKEKRESFDNVNEVSETEKSSSYRRLGKSKTVILEKKRRGNYWIVEKEEKSYLVPSNNLRVNEFNFKAIEVVFECRGYQTNISTDFKLLQPAIVSKTKEGYNWQLEKPGILEF